MKTYGQSLISVTATVQRVPLELNVGYTLINEGAGLIAYRHDTDDTDTLVGASEAALRLVGGAILQAGEKVFLANGSPYVEVACITGATATLRAEPGDMVGNPSDAEIAEGIATGDLVFSTVPISEAALGVADLGVGASGEVVRLHELMVTMLGQGTIAVSYDDDGAAGSGVVALSGAFPIGAGGGVPIAWRKDPDGCLAAAADKHLTVTFGTTGGSGYAIISKG